MCILHFAHSICCIDQYLLPSLLLPLPNLTPNPTTQENRLELLQASQEPCQGWDRKSQLCSSTHMLTMLSQLHRPRLGACM